MNTQTFILPSYFDYGATFLWAISGALLAARRGYAILGILTLAMVSSTGGGLLRDGLFLNNGAPILVRTPIYIQIIIVAVLIVLFFGRRVQHLPQLHHMVGLVDALGLGAYAVVGMNWALAAGLPLIGVGVVGMVNAVGGGILRDVLIRKEPSMFLPGTIEEASALVGCILFLALIYWLSIHQFWAAWITIGLVFAIRIIAVRFHIQSRALKSFEEYWKKSDGT